MRADYTALPDAPVLLCRRMAALAFDPAVVAGCEPGAFGDLRRQCVACACPERCERDLRRDPLGAPWKSYCPNADLLGFMADMWWLKMLL
jgi:hypothetical protein